MRNHGIHPYDHDEHYGLIRAWLKARGLEAPPRERLSEVGYCVDDVAIGFLQLTTSKQAWICDIVADPTVSAWERDHALRHLFHTLEAEAVAAGCCLVTSITNLPIMKRRFARMGYSAHGDFTLYSKKPGGS